jgi:DNA-binding PadR family transcriptional regulator
MAAHSTRMLLLGAVALFEPVNGYQIRRELASWQVEEWANLGPGSIYSGLTTLEKLGQLVRHDLDDDGRVVAVYEMTQAGRDELARLMGHGLETVSVTDSVAFHAAFGMIVLIERPVALRHLEVRLQVLDDVLAQEPHEGAPPHARRGLELWHALGTAERGWLVGTIERIRGGEYDFAGEPWTWDPPADDPGRQMSADRERYLALLGRQSETKASSRA